MNDQGLAQQMVYGDGAGQNTKHVYAGTIKKVKTKKKRKKAKGSCCCGEK